MSALQDFLNAHPVDNLTEEVIISDRFKDKEGNLLRFKIKAMSSGEFEEIRKKSTTVRKGGKVEMDLQKFQSSIVISQTLEPDFKHAESIAKLGCLNPEEYLNKVLLPGEVSELVTRIQQLSGFDRDMSDLVAEAKN